MVYKGESGYVQGNMYMHWDCVNISHGGSCYKMLIDSASRNFMLLYKHVWCSVYAHYNYTAKIVKGNINFDHLCTRAHYFVCIL